MDFLLRKNKVTNFRGYGALVGPNRVLVQGDGADAEVAAKNIIIATGSEPKTLPGCDIDGEFIITSDHALELDRIPRSMLVVGAGAVGVEFASIYSGFGAQVTLIEVLPRIVPLEDEDVSKELRRAFLKQGIEVYTRARLEQARIVDGAVEVAFQTHKGDLKTARVDKLLMATGRAPNTKSIGLERLGIPISAGFIDVTDYMETAVPGIYAIGDVVSTPLLAHVASHEGVLAVERIAGKRPAPIRANQIPSCTYCEPQVASVGLTEAQAGSEGYHVRTGKFPFSALGKAMIEDATEGFVKVVADERHGELLGVHMIGHTVTELISEAVAAMGLEGTVEDLIHTIHAHPTLAEATHEAVEDIYNGAIHL